MMKTGEKDTTVTVTARVFLHAVWLTLGDYKNMSSPGML